MGVMLIFPCYGGVSTGNVTQRKYVEELGVEQLGVKSSAIEKKGIPVTVPKKLDATASGKSAPSKANTKKGSSTAKATEKKASEKNSTSSTEKVKSQVTKPKAATQSNSKKVAVTVSSGKKSSSIRYLKLSEIKCSLKFSTRPLAGGGMLAEKQGVTIKIFPNKDTITYQQSDIFLQNSTKKQGSEILVSYADYLNILVPLLAVNLVTQKAPKVQTIILDPGHGGKDPGAENSLLHLQEKTLTLTLAQQLKTELQKKGYKVELTRDGDRFLELKERSTYSKNGQLFISIHLNSATNKQALGAEIYTLKRGQNFSGNKFDAWNLIAAYTLLSTHTEKMNLKNRGVKCSNFGVLKDLNCPGVLLEVGFVSNNDEAKKFTDAASQKNFVQGFVEGIEKYSNIVKGT